MLLPSSRSCCSAKLMSESGFVRLSITFYLTQSPGPIASLLQLSHAWPLAFRGVVVRVTAWAGPRKGQNLCVCSWLGDVGSTLQRPRMRALEGAMGV